MMASAINRMISRMIRRRVRFWRAVSSGPASGGRPSVGTAMVRPVDAGTAWVAPTAAIMEVTPGSPASTGRPSAKRRRSARSSSADR